MDINEVKRLRNRIYQKAYYKRNKNYHILSVRVPKSRSPAKNQSFLIMRFSKYFGKNGTSGLLRQKRDFCIYTNKYNILLFFLI